MLSAFVRAFKTPDLRKKLLFSLGIMALFRLGSHIPSPGVSYPRLQECLATNDGSSSSLLGVANLFSGGALMQMSIFALGIMPYITASIIVQLLTVVIPKFEALKKEGQAGQTKMTQYTRYLTIALAVLQSATMITYLRGSGLQQMFGPGCTSIMTDESVLTLVIMVLVMTAGTGLIMWLGELVTEHGVGNGMSLLIFTAIAAQFPQAAWQLKSSSGWGGFLGIIVLTLLITAIVVYVEQAQRRIQVQYAKRMIGRRMYGGTSTYVPLKINMANVIPIIFASSLLQLPVMAASFVQPREDGTLPGWVSWVNNNVARGDNWPYMLGYFLLVVFFVFFYVSVTFNPADTADNMKKYGGFIPGHRAGKPTADYLGYVITRLSTVGALYLGILSLVPLIAFARWGGGATNFPLGGASILIVVGVGLETVKQIESKLQQHRYEGFLR